MEQRVPFYLFFLTVLSIMMVGLHLLSADQFSWTSDEGHYHAQVLSFAREGTAALPKMLNAYWATDRAQWYPPPTRLGYIIPVGFLYRFWPSMVLLGLVSFLCYVASIYVNIHFARKFFKDKITPYAMTAILAASPLVMAMARRALTESYLFLLWLSILWLCTDLALNKNKRQLWWIGGLFVLSLLVKESSVVLLPFILLCIWVGRSTLKAPWKEWGIMLSSLFAGLWFIPGVIVGFELWTKSIVALFVLQKEVALINPYVAKYCQGPWFRYLMDALLLSPITTILAIGFAVYLSLQKDILKLPFLWFVFFVSIYVPLSGLQKNIRYVMSLEAVYALFATMALLYLINKFFKEEVSRERMWMVLTALIVINNWSFFFKSFVVRGLLDPVSQHLLSLRHLIP